MVLRALLPEVLHNQNDPLSLISHLNSPTIMNLLKSSLLIAAVGLVGGMPLMAQQKKAASTGGNSPHETTSAVIEGNRVTVTYGRPFSKDRKIWGGLVPWEKAWRTGSDEATVLITQQAIVIGETTLPAGAYRVYTVPSESGVSKMAFSTKLGAWGVPVDEKNDLVRVDMKKEALEPKVDQFTMAVAKNPSGGGVVKLMWDDTQFSVAFTVKK